jgi:micrococcal nuclease
MQLFRARLLGRLRFILGTALAAGVLVVAAQPAAHGRYTLRGTVSYVVDGDTLSVSLAGGRTERVRLIGIDTPEVGQCLARSATATARGWATAQQVVLRGDGTQATRDRYGRLLAYVWLPGGRDLGFRMIAQGLARVYVYGGRPFERLGAYRRAEQIGRSRGANVWRGCGTASPPRGRCDGSYPTVCIPPYPPDLDCAEIPYSNFTVRGNDPHGFDGDGDSVGCED